MDEHFGLNLLSLNDSVTSSTSATQEFYCNSNLNSASSLSWADDEVENYATVQVQHCLGDLENYLLTGSHPDDRCFDLREAARWRRLVRTFKFQELLGGSRRRMGLETLEKRSPVRGELEIHGRSFLHSPTPKFGSTVHAVTPSQSFQTPRIRSAHPIKSSTQTARVRSAHPLSKSSALPGVNSRLSTRSGHVNRRSVALKNRADSFKMPDDSTTIQSVSTRTCPPTKTHIQFNKRIKLLPPSLPKFEDSLSPLPVLPPLNELSPPSVRNKSRTSLDVKTIPTTSKTRSSLFPSSFTLTKTAKPSSAAGQRSKFGQYRPFYSNYVMQPALPSTHRTATTSIRQHDTNIEVSIVGTSLNLFEPISRPVRSVIVPKLRNI